MRRGQADGRGEMRTPRCLPVPICLSTERIGGKIMKVTALVPVVLAAAVLLVSASAFAATGNVGFGFNARDISDFPTGSATLTGGGAYNPVSGFVHSAGGFRRTSDVGQCLFAGCRAGRGLRCFTTQRSCGNIPNSAPAGQ